MPKFNFESALTWTWAITSVLVVGIYLGLIFSESGAIDGTFFELIGALTSLGVLAIGYEGLHSWRVQDRTKMRREYAQKTIGHLTRILELKRNLNIPLSAQDKISEAHQLAKNGYSSDVEELIIDAIRSSQLHNKSTAREVSELIYSAKSSVICVSAEIYNSLGKVNEPFLYYRAQTPAQISSHMPELTRAFSTVDGSNVSAFFFLYDSSRLDMLIKPLQEVERMIESLLYVVEHGVLKPEKSL